MRPCLRIAAALLSAAAGAAHANLVTNGGFETGDFSGWSVLGDAAHASVSPIAPFDGAYTADFTSSSGTVIEQMLATVPGASYDVSFWFRTEGSSINLFDFVWDGASQYSVLDAIPGYAPLSFTLVASSSTTPIVFFMRHGDGRWSLDDVVVTGPDAPGSGPVPEPASLALVSVGLITLMRRRSR